jgi:putative membrane protein
MSLMTIVMLATFVFASPMQQSDTQSNPNKQDKSASSSTKSDKHDHSMQDKHSDSMHDTMSNTTLNSDDRKFIMNAAHGGMMEVKLGHLAVDKATNPDVKQFGQRMVDDHSKANSELMALASQKGITLPASSDSAMMIQNDQSSSTSPSTAQSTDQQSSTSSSGSQQSSMDTSTSGQRHARVDTNTAEMLKDEEGMNKLSGLSGDAFDREYVNMMVKDHEKDVKEFEKASTNAKDSDVRAFATKTLPTLREHLQQVRDIQSRMKSSNKSTTQ